MVHSTYSVNSVMAYHRVDGPLRQTRPERPLMKKQVGGRSHITKVLVMPRIKTPRLSHTISLPITDPHDALNTREADRIKSQEYFKRLLEEQRGKIQTDK